MWLFKCNSLQFFSKLHTDFSDCFPSQEYNNSWIYASCMPEGATLMRLWMKLARLAESLWLLLFELMALPYAYVSLKLRNGWRSASTEHAPVWETAPIEGDGILWMKELEAWKAICSFLQAELEVGRFGNFIPLPRGIWGFCHGTKCFLKCWNPFWKQQSKLLAQNVFRLFLADMCGGLRKNDLCWPA